MFDCVSCLRFSLRLRVKLGVHEESGEQVAVKIMDKSDIKAQEMTMNVRREIAIMKALKHRNIVNLRQVLTSQSKLYIVMDLVTGGELFTKILNEGKLEEGIARRYFQQLVDGIDYCHRRGVCHRDLKPENLLIDETTGELKITDFGLSAMKGASTTEELLHTQCGSPNYCAPEIIARHKQGYSGNKVDAWSCGIILFALLAGFLPFFDENTKVLYRMIQRDDVKFPRKFPAEAKDLVLRLLCKEPEKRYTLTEVKKHIWFAVDYAGDDSTAKPSGSGTSPPASKGKKRRHARKSSVDQAPRARDVVPRKKSDKSDNDSGTHSSTGMKPSNPPPGVHPAPPAITESGPRPVPPQHRQPPPPSVTPPKPRSPLPPLPPPTTGAVHAPVPPPRVPQAPLPPPPPMVPGPPVAPPLPPPPPMIPPPPRPMVAPVLPVMPSMVPPPPRPVVAPVLPQVTPSIVPPPPPPRAVPNPPMSPYMTQGSSRPVPPYPTTGTVRRRSRESREVSQSDIGSVSTGDSNSISSATISGITSSATPSYSSMPGATVSSQIPIPPPFPAPEVHAERIDVHTYAPSPVDTTRGSVPIANGVPTPPQVTFSSTPRTAEIGMSDHRSPYSEAMQSAAAPAVPTVNMEPAAGSRSLHADLPPLPEPHNPAPPDVLSPSVMPKVSSPEPSRPRWVVNGPTRVPSYSSTTMTPVMTPSAFAAGDASWLKSGRFNKTEKAVPEMTVKADTKTTEETETTSEAQNPPSKPLSIVQQRRLLYNKLATEAEVPPPFPDQNFRTPSFKTEPSPATRPGSLPTIHHESLPAPVPAVRPESMPAIQDTNPEAMPTTPALDKLPETIPTPTPRFGDREETPAISGFPGMKSGWTTPSQASSSPSRNGELSNHNYGNEASKHISPLPHSSYLAQGVAGGDQHGTEESRVELVGNTTGTVQLGAGVSVSEEDEAVAVPLKQRLAAALARYRRIFRLGNNIGITASPSFSSNRGSGTSVASGVGADDDARRNSNRAEFFARAKAVTGAWGIILTQELEDDSDSEDECMQVTEAELQAFSRLLDFWDNRRSSANIPKGEEVVLDDENASPLSEEDIASIQSLIQKLEPKQVEDEMTEVAEDLDDPVIAEAQATAISGIAEADNEGGSLDDLEVEDIRLVGVDHIDGPKATSDVSEYIGRAVPSAPSGGSAPPPPPPPPPRAIDEVSYVPQHGVPPPPPPPIPPMRPESADTATWDRGSGPRAGQASAPPPPPPPPPSTPMAPQSSGVSPSPPPPPPYSAPSGSTPDARRLPLTNSTVRDPYRPGVPPAYPPPQHRGNGTVTFPDDLAVEKKDGSSRRRGGSRIPESKSHDADLNRKRKSSTNTSDHDAASRKTVSRDSNRMLSGASAASDGPGTNPPRRGHFRSPSRDEHATRGMFTFGMFNRRKSSANTSFESNLTPDRCLIVIGKILTSMGCSVMIKRGESKMKCEVPMKQDKLLLSITCTQERKVSTVHFKKGRKDRSQVDAREFRELFQNVHNDFLDRVPEDRQS